MKLGTHLRHLDIVLLGLIGLLSLLGQFTRSLTPLGMVSWYELIMVLFVARHVPLALRWTGRLRQHRLFQSFLLFAGWLTFISVVRGWPLEPSSYWLVSGSYGFRFALYAAFALSVAVWAHKVTPFERRQLRNGVYAWLVLQGLIGIGQYLLYPDTRILAYLQWDDHLSRAFGTLFDPGFFGLFMALGAIWSLYALAKSSRWCDQQWALAGLVFFFLATAVSYSRAAYLSLVVGILAAAVMWKNRRFLLFIPLFVLGLFLLPKDGGGEGQNLLRTRSVEQRIEFAQTQTPQKTPLERVVGSGWAYRFAGNENRENNQKLQSNAQVIDNVYLHVLNSAGFVGLALFAWLLWQLWHHANTLGRMTLLIITLNSFINASLIYPWILLLLTLYGAVFLNKKNEPQLRS